MEGGEGEREGKREGEGSTRMNDGVSYPPTPEPAEGISACEITKGTWSSNSLSPRAGVVDGER